MILYIYFFQNIKGWQFENTGTKLCITKNVELQFSDGTTSYHSLDTRVYAGNMYSFNQCGMQLDMRFYSFIQNPPVFEPDSTIRPITTLNYKDLRFHITKYTMYNHKDMEALLLL